MRFLPQLFLGTTYYDNGYKWINFTCYSHEYLPITVVQTQPCATIVLMFQYFQQETLSETLVLARKQIFPCRYDI